MHPVVFTRRLLSQRFVDVWLIVHTLLLLLTAHLSPETFSQAVRVRVLGFTCVKYMQPLIVSMPGHPRSIQPSMHDAIEA